MSRVNDLIEGLQFLKSKLPANGYETLAAEHDIIYGAHKDEVNLNDEEIAKMEKLGWHLDSECDCWSFFT